MDGRPKGHPDDGIDDGFFDNRNDGPPSPPHPDYIPYPKGVFPASPLDPNVILFYMLNLSYLVLFINDTFPSSPFRYPMSTCINTRKHSHRD